MNEQTQITQSLADASPAQLAYLALNGSYGEKLVAHILLESIASGLTPDSCSLTPVPQAFPKGRWTV